MENLWKSFNNYVWIEGFLNILCSSIKCTVHWQLSCPKTGASVHKAMIFVTNFGPGCSVPRTGRSTESIASIIEPLLRHLASGFDHRRRLACWDRPAAPRCESSSRRCAVRLITLAADAFLIAKLLFPPPVMSATPGVHKHDLKDCPYTHRKLPHLILSEQALSVAGTDKIQCSALEDAAIQMRGS